MNLADLDAPWLKIEWPKRPSRSRSQIHAGWKHRHRGDREQVELLARERDAELEEAIRAGCVRYASLERGIAYDYDPYGYDSFLRCVGALEDWWDRRKVKQEFLRREARRVRRFREMERTRRWLEAQAGSTTSPLVCLRRHARRHR